MPTKKRQLAPPLSVRRRLQLLAFRDAGGHGAKPPLPIVAVGTNVAAYSFDNGATWTAGTIPAGDWAACAWIGNKYIAVGTNVAASSVNGKVWTAQAIPAGIYTGVGANGSIAVAVGGSGILSTSLDGLTWAAQPAIVGNPTLNRKVPWSKSLGLFVGVGTGAYSSPDGITWTSGSGVTFQSVEWSPDLGLFAALRGSSATMYTSTNGTAWVSRAGFPSTLTFRVVSWNATAGVFAGACSAASVDSVTSSDGIAWALQNTIPAVTWRWMTVSGGKFVVVATNTVATSPDGVVWTLGTIPAGAWSSVAAPFLGI